MKTTSSGRRATSSLLALLHLAACGGGTGAAAREEAPPPTPVASLGAPIDFAYDSLDDRPVSSEATRGKPTVMAFVDTGSLPAQAQADFLVAMAKHDGAQVNYAVVALEGSGNRELVELYRKSLAISFPVALADAATLAGSGPFGDVTTLPVTVILDRAGRLVWRVAGRVAKSDQIRAALRGL